MTFTSNEQPSGIFFPTLVPHKISWTAFLDLTWDLGGIDTLHLLWFVEELVFSTSLGSVPVSVMLTCDLGIPFRLLALLAHSYSTLFYRSSSALHFLDHLTTRSISLSTPVTTSHFSSFVIYFFGTRFHHHLSFLGHAPQKLVFVFRRR